MKQNKSTGRKQSILECTIESKAVKKKKKKILIWHLPSLRRNELNPSDALSRNETCFYTTYVTNCWSNLLLYQKQLWKTQKYVRPLLSSAVVCVCVVFFDFSYELCKSWTPPLRNLPPLDKMASAVFTFWPTSDSFVSTLDIYAFFCAYRVSF